MSWFAIDRAGLGKILARRGKAFAILELVQNAWDTNTTRVDITLQMIPRKQQARLVVEDTHPEGFTDLSHAYTLFAASEKADDPSKRGRYNLGEKLVLALCIEAEISTTKGTVRFTEDGKRFVTRTKRDKGSVFTATIKMTRAEYAEVEKQILRLLPPVHTTFNGHPIEYRKPLHTFETTLQTVRTDDEGNLTRTKRKTAVDIHDADSSGGWIYELGIPVVHTRDRFHVNVQQKVPVNLDRDNVPPSYLRQLRTEVLNAMASQLTSDEAAEPWVTNALDDDSISAEAVKTVVTKRYGEKRAIYDPSDTEANHQLVANGYKVIHGGAFSSAAWKAIRESGAAKPSGKILPTPKPYSTDPNAKPVNILPPEEWTPSMRRIVKLIRNLGDELLGETVIVTIVRAGRRFSACYGSGLLGSAFDLNLTVLGRKWFDAWPENQARVLDLILHEYGHYYADSHLSDDYHKALTDLGGRLAVLALEKPELFK